MTIEEYTNLMRFNLQLVEKKQKQKETETNKKCQSCRDICKQPASVDIIYCPMYKKIDKTKQ
jgi:hypothetical protein